ncbi:MAG: adenosylcobalamin-dependent ribonucleoside-diphosphate reductase [Phycisphaerae bacterium]|nr:adenosylcobalamin-dependent ribonucleoside-diphosphate reductase [Phycisphaerae bacterium]
MTAVRKAAAPVNAALKDEPLLTENAAKVLQARYLKKDESGACTETPRDLFRRVAKTVADVETTYGGNAAQRQHWEDRFYRIMADGHFMPNSPTLMNAGREMGMLSACFVLPVRDSVNDIFDSIKYTALIQKAGGGTGFAFDELRPTGDYIASSGGTTSGPITFWRAFSEATNAIQQGAFRRGANMGMMYIHHPDILKFLHAKQDLTQFTNYNISVKVTDAWMDQYRADADTPHLVRNPRNGKVFALPRDLKIWEYDVKSLIEIDPSFIVPVFVEKRESYFCSPKLLKPLPADLAERVYTKRMIWDIIVQNAWQTGEPGVVFIDRINEHNPTPHVGRIEATNPCGEQPLLPFEACNLGSVNLGAFVRNECTPQALVDWDALRDAVWVSTRFLDNVIDANNYPLEQIDHICKTNRKIGIGIMGFADALYRLNVAYNTDEGVAWGEKFMKFVNDEAHNCSEQLARERGNFANWEGSIWQTRHNRPMRNAAVTTVAPTGTISIIANCSGGVEPMFSLAFIRNVLRGQKEGARPLVEVNDTFRMVAAKRGFLSDDLLERIAHEGTLAHIDEIPEDIRRVFVCAHDITPEWHMRMQAGFQRHCDSSISKTINFANAATRDDVEKIYTLAYDLRCKGVTVYRDGCRNFQPMALKKKDDAKAEAAAPVAAAPAVVEKIVEKIVLKEVIKEVPRQRIEPMDLPEIVSSIRIRQLTPFGNLHCTISVDPRTGRELEIFAHLGKGGDVATSDLEGMGRIGSLWLRSGGSLTHLIKQWQGIGSSLQIPTKTGRITSLPDGLAAALQRYMKAKERFGLAKLLLGEVDLAELDRPIEAGPSPAPAISSTGNGGNPGNGGNGGNGGHPVSPSVPPAIAQRLAGDALTSAPQNRLAQNGASHNGTAQNGAAQNGATHHKRAADGISNAAGLAMTGHAANGHTDHVSAADAAVATALADFESAEAAVDHDLADSPVFEVVETEITSHTDTLISQRSGEIVEHVSTTTTTQSHCSLVHQHDAASHFKLKCPECQTTVARQEGCLKCVSCGWAQC